MYQNMPIGDAASYSFFMNAVWFACRCYAATMNLFWFAYRCYAATMNLFNFYAVIICTPMLCIHGALLTPLLSLSLYVRVGIFHSYACFCSNACIFILQPLALTCEACGTQKNRSVGNLKGWSCKFCTLDNSSMSERCLACGEWRYSYGPPISTPGPYPGT